MRVAFPTDEHYPFQDERARSVALQIVSDFDPLLRVTGSDSLDFYNLSHFDKDPERVKVNLQNEIDAWQKGEREWRDASPSATPRWLGSNHLDRLRRWLWNHHELSGLRALELPNLLELERLGVQFDRSGSDHADSEIEIEGKLLIKHGAYVRKFSAATAKAELEAEFHDITVLTGHTHRGGSYYVTTRHGLVQAHEAFCLCRLDPPYLQHPNWQQGLLLAEVAGDIVSIEPIPFFTLRGHTVARWRGKEYRNA